MSESEQFETYAGGALQVHVQGQHIEVLEAKVARLREALESAARQAVRYMGIIDEYCVICGYGPVGEHHPTCPFAALSTPADDWLARHDEQVRQAEREHHAEAVCLGVHLGDPCVFCGTPCDEIEPGPCPGHIAPTDDRLARHGAEVRAQERERCAAMCDEHALAIHCAAAIREGE